MENNYKQNENHAVLTRPEVCAILRVSRGVVDGLIKQKEIRSLKLGRRILVPKKALQEYIDGKSTKMK